MKVRNILIVIAIFLFLFNSPPYISGNIKIPEDNLANKIGYMIGYNIFILAGLILLLIAFFIHRKVRRNRRMAMVDSLLK